MEVIIAIVALAILLTWILALVEILQSKFSGNNKVIWLLVVFFLSFIGAVLYFSIGRKQRIGLETK